MLFRAIELAAKVHAGQYRKGTNVPYLSHIMNVCKTLCEYNCSEEIITAGILHDTVEDTYLTLKDIELLFGRRVSDIVRGVTEPEKLNKQRNNKVDVENWKQRKLHTLDFLKSHAHFDVLIVTAADKLDNIRVIKSGIQHKGENIWEQFNAGRVEQEWYYTSLAQILLARAEEFGEPLFSIAYNFDDIVRDVFIKQEGDFILYETKIDNKEDIIEETEINDERDNEPNPNDDFETLVNKK